MIALREKMLSIALVWTDSFCSSKWQNSLYWTCPPADIDYGLREKKIIDGTGEWWMQVEMEVNFTL